ncbi:MAG: benzoate/H(+) symporter BenE family transporter [Tatlockia sp.]|nr:benzoate/H(+) symporter BenE family transporter [Tatlockia sp.]
MRNPFSIANITAGFIAVLIGFTSSAVLVFQAASTAGATPAEVSSWLFALGLSIGAVCIGLSLYYRMPILIGWSTPGAALLIVSLSGVTMPEAIGAFIFAAFLTIVAGASGFFEKIMMRIPPALTSAMLAGILLHFGLDIFKAMQDQVLLVGAMLFAYLLGKRYFPRYVIILVLLVGVCITKVQGLFLLENVNFNLTLPLFTYPVFSLPILISVGLPLFIVTMTSQNMPGIAVLNASGFRPPITPLLSWIGLVNLLFAPFGCYSISLTALTAAICASKEIEPNPGSRFKSTVFAGLCWLVIGIFGAAIVSLFFAFPKELLFGIAGLALIGTLGSSLKSALEEDSQREPALITILVSASGFTFFGIGAACWGLLAGILSSLILNGINTKYGQKTAIEISR